ncbi:hypothetical protein [Pseudonocardia sp. TRM90224]|uniref:hypothetical protein n=1 Tax=Pseudonocardia sp. TRM90224 TaxID=2812678 RepID=UPI001E516DFD|nr:hypothetical protein [Pseudonocardia sp. TRM90224]
MTTAQEQEACEGHPGLAAELRTVVLTALDRLGPLLDDLRAEPVPGTPPAACASCPVCAVIAALRGERSELGVRLAEQASGMITVLRAALEEGTPAAPGPVSEPAAASTARPNGRTVQYIHVERR